MVIRPNVKWTRWIVDRLGVNHIGYTNLAVDEVVVDQTTIHHFKASKT